MAKGGVEWGAPSQSLSGILSATIGNLTNLRQVLLQNNNISGVIPPELGSLPKLQTLDLSNNRFSGVIPPELGQLNSLQYLRRLNNNSLGGPFPVSLAKIPQLAFLDLSYNNLSGPVPKFPARTFNVVGNPLICGSSSTNVCSGSANSVPLSFSLDSSTGKHNSKKLATALGVSLSVASLILIALGLLWHRQRQKNLTIIKISDKQEEGLINLGNLRNFAFRELHQATDNFSSKNILGAGGFGNVYKGKLGDGTMVAVKRLKDVAGTFGESQFRTELEMISLAVHRNLLRLIGYCATPNERLLVYPYMSNGSVASRLRGLYNYQLCFKHVKKIQQEKKVEVLVDRELGNSYDRIEVGEMLQVALLCTQYLPAHRPKMSEVVRMLEGDGLAEKWAASHNHTNPTMNPFHVNNNTKSTCRPTAAPKHDHHDDNGQHDQSSMFGTMDDDDDDHSLDSYAMELSGPR
ncbi:hypothetical protein EZV62_012223 [Acer yangbiense]|uniref:Protein kinase domain-containing protein n=1 Tax=Acer yangbiense TaxID=1000413 RepID=A0A5C7HV95_9ROSI|nr:hypothetical protein EZV62_012223 [Acer yangbiense]